jgi:hypothetical protein
MVEHSSRCRKNAITYIILATLTMVLCACKDNSLDEYKTIQLNLLKVSEVGVRVDNSTQVADWDVCDTGQIVVLRNTSMSIYDGNTGEMISVHPLNTMYKQVECQGNKQYLMNEQMGKITVIDDGQAYDIVVPDSVKHDWRADIATTGRSVLLRHVGQSFIYDMVNHIWSQYPDYHFVGEDGLSYYYNHGKVHAYDTEGRTVGVYSTIPYDPSPLYTIGMSSSGDWHLIAEPMVDKNAEDDVEFIVLNVKKQTFGRYKLKNGWYKLRGSDIFQMKEGGHGTILITKWQVSDTHM